MTLAKVKCCGEPFEQASRPPPTPPPRRLHHLPTPDHPQRNEHLGPFLLISAFLKHKNEQKGGVLLISRQAAPSTSHPPAKQPPNRPADVSQRTAVGRRTDTGGPRESNQAGLPEFESRFPLQKVSLTAGLIFCTTLEPLPSNELLGGARPPRSRGSRAFRRNGSVVKICV